MNFDAALNYMKRGHAVALPEWGGFWEWFSDEEGIVMRLRTGESLLFSDTEDWSYTLSFLSRTDWAIVDEETTEYYKNLALEVNTTPDEEDTSEVTDAFIEELLEYVTAQVNALPQEEEEDDEITPCGCLRCTLDRLEEEAKEAAEDDMIYIVIHH